MISWKFLCFLLEKKLYLCGTTMATLEKHVTIRVIIDFIIVCLSKFTVIKSGSFLVLTNFRFGVSHPHHPWPHHHVTCSHCPCSICTPLRQPGSQSTLSPTQGWHVLTQTICEQTNCEVCHPGAYPTRRTLPPFFFHPHALDGGQRRAADAIGSSSVEYTCLLLFLPFAVSLPSLILEVSVYPFKRGFFCDDESISHPYKEDTITMFTVAFVGITLPVVVVSRGDFASPTIKLGHLRVSQLLHKLTPSPFPSASYSLPIVPVDSLLHPWLPLPCQCLPSPGFAGWHSDHRLPATCCWSQCLFRFNK